MGRMVTIVMYSIRGNAVLTTAVECLSGITVHVVSGKFDEEMSNRIECPGLNTFAVGYGSM